MSRSLRACKDDAIRLGISIAQPREMLLESVGAAELQEMLDGKNWEALRGRKFIPHTENLWA